MTPFEINLTNIIWHEEQKSLNFCLPDKMRYDLRNERQKVVVDKLVTMNMKGKGFHLIHQIMLSDISFNKNSLIGLDDIATTKIFDSQLGAIYLMNYGL